MFFDLDGTLTDPQEGITNCVKYALEYFGIYETDYSKLLRFIGPPLVWSFSEYY
ncbi:MAG: HAD hydrolase-like protein [Clostridia bacterium]|nr:HAD hydrolase-like protein [Clostridia bacterium]